ncbi:MAG TPA: YihY/virulence factor BrkB family protein [Anaeromyxobacter sp.]|nr:YihY/virulence factor BrkB family protein [Anaeromyxobacter sp.]
MRPPGNGMSWRELLVGLRSQFERHATTDVAAGVTYYGLLSLFPFILFLVSLGSLFLQPKDAEQIVQQLSQVAPGPATEIIGDRIRQLAQSQSVSLVGFAALAALWAASGAALAIIHALDTAYDAVERRPFWKVRGLAVLMTIVSAVLALVAAFVAIALGPIGDAIGGPIGAAMAWLRLPIAGLLMMFLWALAYYFLPDVQQRFRLITPGSAIGVIVWVVASWGFSKYVSHFGSYDKTYGSLGGVIVLLLWMWLSSLVLLAGAEVNAFVGRRSLEGKRQGVESHADTGMTATASVAGKEPAQAERKPRLRGIMAIATGFLAGVLVSRRTA